MSKLRILFGDDATILKNVNFQLLLLASVVGPLGITLMSPVLDSLIDPLGATPATIGLMISFVTAPAIISIPVGGALADHFGRKPIIITALVLFGLSGTAISFTTDFRIALGLRFLQGVAYGGLTPVIITTIGDTYEGTKEATAQGLRFTGSGVTQTVFPLLAGALVTISWQYPFYIYAIAIPTAVLVYLWMPEPENKRSRRSISARSYIPTILNIIRNRRVAALVAARALPVMVWIGFLTYNSFIIVHIIGGTPSQAGILVALGSVVYAFAASQAGRITDVLSGRLTILAISNFVVGLGYGTFIFAHTFYSALFGIIIAGSGFGIALSLYRSVITQLAPPNYRAGVVSISESGGQIVATLTPVIMGGIISVATPVVGVASSVRLAGVASLIVSVGGGMMCLHLAKYADPMNDTL